MWVAIKPFRYRDVAYAAGDEVPADKWPNRRALEITRKIRRVSDKSPVHAPSATAVAPVAPDLSKLKRAELNEYAMTLGIGDADDTDVYPNRQSLIDAVEALQAPVPPPTVPGTSADRPDGEPPAKSGGVDDQSTPDAEGDDDLFADLNGDDEEEDNGQ